MSKYKNPIVKVEMVTIPTWEYADLIRAATLMTMTKKLVDSLEEYKLRDTLKVLYGEGKEDAE